MNENNSNQGKLRQKYSPQFKDQALARAEKDGVPKTASFWTWLFESSIF